MSPQLPFFVYGTLRPGEVNHDLFLRGRTRAEEPGRLTGPVLYAGPGYPYAVEAPGGEGHGEVRGELRGEVSREVRGELRGAVSREVRGELVTAVPERYAELLAALDRLEEYAPGDPGNLYERVEREVRRDADGALVRAWVYVAAPAVAARLLARGRPIESGDWLLRSLPGR